MLVEYRRAPEAPFPEPLNDCYSALEWIAEYAASFGGDPSRLAVAGTSAGGNLSAAVAMKTRDEHGPNLAHQVLFVPVIDHNFETDSYRNFSDDYFLTRDSMIYFWDHYVGEGASGGHPNASPIRADSLAGLPPATIRCAMKGRLSNYPKTVSRWYRLNQKSRQASCMSPR
jgi:acetyl esterase